ncbi:MAG TPA: hypothetical protein P5154_02280 [Candidatus Izemoplasmatales bacterium]|nr:hypothetical protein [Candidatus Izemoplasmatales bacterium]
MLPLAFAKLKTRKYLIQSVVFFTVFLVLYSMIDHLNLPYPEMIEIYGRSLVVINVLLNVVMSAAGAVLMALSGINVELRGKEGKGSNLGFFSVFFGMLTYGCTSCVISFFAAVGIAFSVVALPLAGLPYKLISLILVSIGLLWMVWEIKTGKCRVPKAER